MFDSLHWAYFNKPFFVCKGALTPASFIILITVETFIYKYKAL